MTDTQYIWTDGQTDRRVDYVYVRAVLFFSDMKVCIEIAGSRLTMLQKRRFFDDGVVWL